MRMITRCQSAQQVGVAVAGHDLFVEVDVAPPPGRARCHRFRRQAAESDPESGPSRCLQPAKLSRRRVAAGEDVLVRAKPSMRRRMSVISGRIDSLGRAATAAPALGRAVTRPSWPSLSSASRTGPRLTRKRADSSCSRKWGAGVELAGHDLQAELLHDLFRRWSGTPAPVSSLTAPRVVDGGRGRLWPGRPPRARCASRRANAPCMKVCSSQRTLLALNPRRVLVAVQAAVEAHQEGAPPLG